MINAYVERNHYIRCINIDGELSCGVELFLCKHFRSLGISVTAFPMECAVSGIWFNQEALHTSDLLRIVSPIEDAAGCAVEFQYTKYGEAPLPNGPNNTKILYIEEIVTITRCGV